MPRVYRANPFLHSPMKQHPGQILRDSMDRGPVAAPGAFNGLVARAVAQAGFKACYLSGGAISAAAGVPDVGILSLDRFVMALREVVLGSGLPVIADADTGFGEEEMVRRTVIEYNAAGAAGLHIEDQVFPKRCGHLAGKQLIPVEQALGRLAWAVEAAQDCSDGRFIVCARTDARSVEGLNGTIERAHAYAEAGAAMIFPEGLESEEEFATVAQKLGSLCSNPPYLLANMTEFGKTPIIPFKRFGELGYHIVIFPVSTLRTAMGAITAMLTNLKASGSVSHSLESMQSRADLYAMLGYEPQGGGWKYPTG